jgi:hypothetical protein
MKYENVAAASGRTKRKKGTSPDFVVNRELTPPAAPKMPHRCKINR